jgi:RNA polymerase sigma-70 factor (ECF subfamily)
MDEQGAMALTKGGARASTRRRLTRGYQDAFVEVYQRYYPRIFAYVYSRVGNVELSRDLVAEVFENAYVKGHTVREPAAYHTWLFTVAKRVVIGHHRRLVRQSRGMDNMQKSVQLSDQRSDPEAAALRSEAASNLMRHVRRLPQRDQDLLSLKFDGELTYSEIGHVLKMSGVNVRVAIFRALKRLRALIEEEERLDAGARPAGGSAAALSDRPQSDRLKPLPRSAGARAPTREPPARRTANRTVHSQARVAGRQADGSARTTSRATQR